MESKKDEFKAFVKEHPLLLEIVNKKEKTWQNLFEEWSLMPDSNTWDKYKKEGSVPTTNMEANNKNPDIAGMVKNCIDYVKKINPDNVTKTISSIQKLMALVAGIGAANTVGAASGKKLTGDPLFDRRFDEWY